jgi:hypothetical protein
MKLMANRKGSIHTMRQRMNLNMRNFRSAEVRHDSAAQTIHPGWVMACARFKGGA